MDSLRDSVQAALQDRYAIIREIGRGGMATVFLADDLKHRRKIAIKVLRPDLAAALGPERFLREIEVTAGLHHPHILALYDSGYTDGVLYYVMPYAEGESVGDRLKREKQLPVDQAIQIACEVADALDYAHRHGVIHRDIKPDNVLLEEQHAVVADFGIARAIAAAGGDRVTATGVTVGTAAYMSPEQAAGDKEIDGRSDVYSLGCLLYEMLAGEPPFTGPTADSIIHQHLAADPPSVSAIRSAVPASLSQALRRALAKTPADRYATAAGFASAVRTAAHSTDTVPVAAPSSRRRFVLGGAMVAIVAAIASLTWLSLGRMNGANANDTASPRLAVVPFENLGAPEDEYFTDGISDELMVKLAGLRGLTVIARQSAIQYKGSQKSAKQIGSELGVGYLLSGTIRSQPQSDGSRRVRVAPQLIRTSDEVQLWSDTFDEPVSDVFQLQSLIAQRVARASGVVLLSGDQAALQSRPTDNLQAYEYFLRGNAHFREGFPVLSVLRDAITMYEKAVELDSNFALAFARLSEAHGGLRWGNHDLSPERLKKQEAAARRAVMLEPRLPEARVAMAWYYLWGHLDYDRALKELAPALEAQPRNAEFILLAGAILRRQGQFAAAVEKLATASDLDPLGWSPAFEAGTTYLTLRRYDEAERYFNRFASIVRAYANLAYLRLMRGDGAGETRVWLQRVVGIDSVSQVIASAVLGGSHDGMNLSLVRSLCGECRAALSGVPNPGTARHFLGKALLHKMVGAPQLSRAYYDSALRRLTAPRADGPPREYQWLAMAYLGLGRHADAVRAAQDGVAWYQRRDAWLEIYARGTLAETYVQVGDFDAALKEVSWLLNHPSFFSPGRLRADPLWDPIRSDPRFQRLLVERHQSPSR